ncbi:L-threonylcarbamoyladenylate synthase [Roseiflexus sp.]|uniref:L-threonylcarbamoyladenylate synthase n=1 Tax=Roseiflexus sp. TaxID=2562120 RepID=UPI0021DE97A6|nr:L-threonylcarbamoyladenylate synthase [Roseiflexus sp.]GIW03111.1 MAG: threonylcarbamoyl-AMP synthase [Roseiflexus sp.]
MSNVVATRVLVVDPSAPDPRIIAEAAAVIEAGGLVAFPTETVYGLGANALDERAVARIFRAKGRPATDPIIAHIADLRQLDMLARDIPPVARVLAQRFWPGPLTLVMWRRPIVPANLSAGRATVAVRMPAHPVALALIAAAGVPIAAPSANRFSRPSPTTAAHVLDDLAGCIDLVLDGGPTLIGIESSVVDLTTDPPRLLRPGGVTVAALRELLPELIVEPRYLSVGDEAAPAPGMLLRHYAPDAPLIVVAGEREAVLARIRSEALMALDAGKRVGMLAFDEDVAALADLPVQVVALGSATDPGQVAQCLFAALREIERIGVDLILVRDPGREGLRLAVRDRLVRAAEGRVINAE